MIAKDILRLHNEYDRSTGLNNFDLDEIVNLTIMSDLIISNIELFESNIKRILINDEAQRSTNKSILDELFKTKFHIKYLFDRDDNQLIYEDFQSLEEYLNQSIFPQLLL